eukprot:4244891-Amphidinium_carterae.1
MRSGSLRTRMAQSKFVGPKADVSLPDLDPLACYLVLSVSMSLHTLAGVGGVNEVAEVDEVEYEVVEVGEVDLEVEVVDSSARNAVQTTTACKVKAKYITCIAAGLRSRSLQLRSQAPLNGRAQIA